MRIKMCHAHCEHCNHAVVADLDLHIHQSPDGVFSLSAVCRDEALCLAQRLTAAAVDGLVASVS